jgi:hypothetical protein
MKREPNSGQFWCHLGLLLMNLIQAFLVDSGVGYDFCCLKTDQAWTLVNPMNTFLA